MRLRIRVRDGIGVKNNGGDSQEMSGSPPRTRTSSRLLLLPAFEVRGVFHAALSFVLGVRRISA